ncbi:MAG: hypothetical protein AB7T49_08295 [Oligoflexales bacterium]
MRIKLLSLFVALAAGCYRAPTVPAVTGNGADFSGDSQETPQPVASEEISEAEEVSEEPQDQAIVPIELNAENIKKLCAENTKMSVVQPLVFPLRDAGCSFGMDPNESSAGGSTNAREIDEASLALSSENIICDISIASKVNTLVHDDDLYFLMDQYVVASDIGQNVMLLGQVNGMYAWDFTKILNAPSVATANKVKYCLGGDQNCVAQENSAGSAFQSTLKSSEIAPIMAGLIGSQAPAIKFSLIVASDDERGLNCYHDEFALEAKIDYIANPNIMAP